MDKLYEHIMKKQEEKMCEMMKKIEALEADKKSANVERKDVSVDTAKTIINTANISTDKSINKTVSTSVDKSTNKTVISTTNNFSINVFGNENISHITQTDIWNLLQKLGPTGENMRKASERLILSTAMMIFSDEKRPENITCYLPNKKSKEALVHGEHGWEVMPVSLTLSPIASKSVDALFSKQPFPGLNGIDPDSNIDEASRILRYIADHEGDLVGDAASPASELRAIPIRNKDILERVLSNLPVAGDK